MRKHGCFFAERMLLCACLGAMLLLSACTPDVMDAPALTLAPTETPAPMATPAPETTPVPETAPAPEPAANAEAEQNMCLMPDVMWETADFAIELIAACNPQLSIEYTVSDELPSGLVAGQSLAEGQRIDSGAAITLTVSMPAPTAAPKEAKDSRTEPVVEAGPTPEPTPYITAMGLVRNPDGTFSDPNFSYDASDGSAPEDCG